MNVHLPAHLPTEEAEEYLAQFTGKTPGIKEFRQSNDFVPINGFADYQIGWCPIRQSPSFWLIDIHGHFWTASTWHTKGYIDTCWEGHHKSRVDWPIMPEGPDYSPVRTLLLEHGRSWNVPGETLTVAEVGGFQIGPWADASSDERETVRALMIHAFDQEWGRRAFISSAEAAMFKHKRVTRKHRRKIRLNAA
jgi:hypothetical protein